MGLGQSKSEEAPQQSPALAWAQTVEKALVLALVSFIVYEAMKFSGSAGGNALAKMFGALSGFMIWMAAHPVLLVAIIFSAIFSPFLVLLGNAGLTVVKGRIDAAKKVRENSDEVEKKAKDAAEANCDGCSDVQIRIKTQEIAEGVYGKVVEIEMTPYANGTGKGQGLSAQERQAAKADVNAGNKLRDDLDEKDGEDADNIYGEVYEE